MVTDEEFALVEKRLEAWNEKIGIAYIEEGEMKNMNKKEMLERLKSKDKISDELVEIQLNYMRQLKERK